MRYQYNYAFLQEWMDANPKLAKGHLQNALGVKSNNGIRSWQKKEGPMPIVSMLRFCNTFQVPLSAFIRDIDADEYKTVIPLPRINDQLEPDGGYAESASDRQRGERTILNPLDVTVMRSVVPGMEDINDNDNLNDNDNHNHDDINAELVKALINMEKELATQRNRYLDIIVEQQKQIADLTSKMLEMKGEQHVENKYHVIKEYVPGDYSHPSIAAEDEN